jgi:hypothetical protein
MRVAESSWVWLLLRHEQVLLLLPSVMCYLMTLSLSWLHRVDDRMIYEYEAVGGMRIGRRNRSTRRKPSPVPLCPPQTPYNLKSNRDRRGGKPATNRLSYGTAQLSKEIPTFRRNIFLYTKVYGVIFHKTIIFIFTVDRTPKSLPLM